MTNQINRLLDQPLELMPSMVPDHSMTEARFSFHNHDDPDNPVIGKARRNMFLGHWCGYIMIPSGPFTECIADRWTDSYGVASHISTALGAGVTIHGGITYLELEEDDNLWIGFDCGHRRDFVPAVDQYDPGKADAEGREYRDIRYVEKNMRELADMVIDNREAILATIEAYMEDRRG